MKNKNARHSMFRIVFARVFTGAVAVIVLALAVLWAVLASYQKSLPSTFPEAVLESYQTGDAGALLTQCDNMPAGMTEERLSAYLATVDKTDLFVARSGEGEDGVQYTLYSGRQKLGIATVRPLDKKGLFGFARYEKVGFVRTPAFFYTVQAPEGVAVLGDGEPLEPFLDTTQSALPFYEEVGLHCGVSLYKIPDCWGLSQVTAEGADNTVVKKSDDGHTFAVRLVPNEKTAAEVEAFVTSLSKKYMVFATKENVGRYTLLNITVKDSSFYNTVNSYYNDWGMTYSKDSFDDFVLSDCTKYTDTEYSCHVSMNYNIYFGNNQKTYPLSATFYVTKSAGTWQAVAMELG